MFWCNMERWQRQTGTYGMFAMSARNIGMDTRHGYWLDQPYPMLSNAQCDSCQRSLLFRNIKTECNICNKMGDNDSISRIDSKGGGICKWNNVFCVPSKHISNGKRRPGKFVHIM